MITKDNIIRKEYGKLIRSTNKHNKEYDKWDWRMKYYDKDGIIVTYNISDDNESGIVTVFFTKCGTLSTSLVKSISENNSIIKYTTLNSMYIFDKNYTLTDSDKEFLNNLVNDTRFLVN